MEYVDLYVAEEGSWAGIAGIFVLWSDATRRDTNVEFTYTAKDDTLSVTGVAPELAAQFRDAWLADAREEYARFVAPLKAKN